MTDEIPLRPRPVLSGSSGGGGRSGGTVGGGFLRSFGSMGRPQQAMSIVLALLILLFVLAPLMARRATDFMWFREIGYERVFVTKVVAQWTLGLVAGIAAFAILYANARVALRGLALAVATAPVLDRTREGPASRAPILARLAELLAFPACVLFTVIIASLAATQWRTLVQFFYRSPFGVSDPVFGRDVSYYVFTLPLLDTGLDHINATLLVALGLIVIPIYYARYDIGRRGWRTRVEPAAQLHLAVLAAALLVVAGLRTLLVEIPSLLQAPHGPLQGASYTDLHVRLPLLRVMGVLTLIGAVALFLAARRGRLVRDTFTILGGYI